MPRTAAASGRVELRLGSNDKDMLQLAAFYEGMSLAAFVRKASLEAARSVVERNERLLHDSIKYPPIDNRNDPPRLSKEVLSHAKKKEDHGLRCVQQWRIKNHDQTRRKSEDPAPDTR